MNNVRVIIIRFIFCSYCNHFKITTSNYVLSFIYIYDTIVLSKKLLGEYDMSAIWGEILYQTQHIQYDYKMRSTYEKKCRIDKINEISDTNLLFGCGIQYITKEAEYEVLPFYSKQLGLYFTTDCILDNRLELMKELGIIDNCTPDGSLIYKAYIRWGVHCLNHFQGLYSIACYDIKTKTLFLATDHTSSRCLYYYVHENGCTFSTLLEPILKVHPDISLNEYYIKDYLIAPYLTSCLSATETPYKDVYKIEAGTYLSISPISQEIKRYWSPEILPLKFDSPQKCKENFISIFDDAVCHSTRCSAGVAVALSSGFDSSSVAASAARTLKKQNKNLYSYTYIPYHQDISYISNNRYSLNEKASVMKTVSMYPNIIPKFLNTNGQDCYQYIDKLLNMTEIPFKTLVNLPSYLELIQEAVQDGCKIILTGQYGNHTISYGNFYSISYELYNKRKYIQLLSIIHKHCKVTSSGRKNTIKRLRSNFKNSMYHYAQQTLNRNYIPINPYLDKKLIDSFPYKDRFSHSQYLLYTSSSYTKELYDQLLFNTSVLSFCGEIDTKLGLLYGVVLRDPTRDCNVLSFCTTMPYNFFVYNGIPRWLIRECYKEYLPKEIVSMQKQCGLQNADWLFRVNQNWDCIYESLKHSLQSNKITQYINQEAVDTLLNNIEDSNSQLDYQTLQYAFTLNILSNFLAEKK